MSIYGYVRVSGRDQNPDRQGAALVERGIPAKQIFVDKISGKDFERPAYKKLLKKLKTDDLLIVKSIDRLGRNYGEILEQWKIITEIKMADVEVLDFPLLNTRSMIDGLTGKFIADLVLQVLAYVAQTEREFIHQRQAEGIAIAKACGIKFGRPAKPLPSNFLELCHAWEIGELTANEAAKMCNMPQSTFRYKAKQYMANKNVK